MVAAGFWKHNIVAIPLTAVVWLLLRNGKAAVRPVLASAAAAGAGLLLCTAIYGRAFPDNLFATREYSIQHVVGHIGHLQWFAVAFVIWGCWAWSARTSAAARFTVLHVAIGLATCLLQWSGHGVGRNAEFDLVIALGIGIGVAFERISPAEKFSFYFVRLDGTGLRRLTLEGRERDPAPIPGGHRLAYVGNGDIHVLDLRTGTRTRLTRTPTQYKAGLAVSPDAKRIAFTRIEPGRMEQIFVMDIDGTNVRRVSRGDFYDYLPRWSPDGTRLAFTSSRDGTTGVYSMRVDGTDVVDLSRTPVTLSMRPGRSVLQVTETLWAWR